MAVNVMDVIWLTGEIAVRAVALLVGTKYNQASARLEHPHPFAEHGFGVVKIFEKVGRKDIVEHAISKPDQVRGITEQLRRIRPYCSVLTGHVHANRGRTNWVASEAKIDAVADAIRGKSLPTLRGFARPAPWRTKVA